MLIRFGVANHRSIRDYQELHLTASKQIKRKGRLIPVPTLKEDAVPIAALYGANAAGKSNLIDALDDFHRVVANSHRSLDATAQIRRRPFRLDNKSSTTPTQFDCTFTVGRQGPKERDQPSPESVYEYGFKFTEKEFQHEWLYRVVRKERQSTQVLFDRKTEDGQVNVSFGSQLRGENRTIANITRANSLFLSAAAQNNHPLLTHLYRYLTKRWMIILDAGPMNHPQAAQSLSDYSHMEHLLHLVRQADIGITEIDVEDEEIQGDRAVFARDFAELMSRHFGQSGEPSEFSEESLLEAFVHQKRIRFVHTSADDNKAALGYQAQSKGTQTLISLLIPALDALSHGSLLVIDELDTSLHPSLARAFVSLFSKEKSNPYGAQLIFSTHDVALLDSGRMHQDEIWMTDKSREGVTYFTPLTEFKLRSRDDMEKAYRLGRLGGVPVGDDFFVNLRDDTNSAET